MEILYKNLIINYIRENIGEYTGATDAPGLVLFNIPKKDIIAMKREGFYSTKDYNGKEYNLIPRMEIEDYLDSNDDKLVNINRDIVNCYNTDTYIIYLNFLLSRKTKRNITVSCEHPYWVFHDILHAENDVAGVDVYVSSANTERCRLQDAIDLLLESGIEFETFDDDYIIKLQEDFWSRWRTDLNVNFSRIQELEINIEDYEYKGN